MSKVVFNVANENILTSQGPANIPEIADTNYDEETYAEIMKERRFPALTLGEEKLLLIGQDLEDTSFQLRALEAQRIRKQNEQTKAVDAVIEELEKQLEEQMAIRKGIHDRVDGVYFEAIERLTEREAKLEKLLQEAAQAEDIEDNCLWAPGARVMVDLKTTKSTVVKDKSRLTDILVKNDKVEEGVKSFSLSFVRKLVDIGLVPDDVASLVPTKRAYVRRRD